MSRPSDFDAVAYINEPRWQRSRLGLDRIRALLQAMGNPQERLRFIHVAGTNGKGSVCAYLACVLQQAGYRTGLFTSPYIFEFAERIRVDGRNIPEEDLIEVTLFVRRHAEELAAKSGDHATEFELMCAVAFEYFARCHCDVVVCEVGLGGRLDSTNVIERPELCVIGRIGLDHTELLGSTLQEVAAEKAGILKPGARVVSWPQEPKAMAVIQEAAAKVGQLVTCPDFSRLEVKPVVDGRRPFVYGGHLYETVLLGSYQPFNAALALTALGVLDSQRWDISQDSLIRGIAAARWPGRFQVVQPGPPPIVVDGGHNPQGARALCESLRDVFPDRGAVFIMGVLADKDYGAMIDAVAPLARGFVCVTPPSPRALPGRDLAAAIVGRIDGVAVTVAEEFSEAVVQARTLARSEDVICAFGSLYSLAALTEALG